MDRESVSLASNLLEGLWDQSPPQAAREALRRVLAQVPAPEEQAAVEMLHDVEIPDVDRRALLMLAGGVVFVAMIVASEGAIDGYGVTVRRIPLEPARSRVSFVESLVDDDDLGMVIVRRWVFELAGGAVPLQFETRTRTDRPGLDHVENFARALASELGWRQE
jgi:hypothetical protein